MNKEILFEEKQKFNQWFIMLIFFAVNAFFIYGIFIQIIEKQQFGRKPTSDGLLILSTIVSVLITILLMNIRLYTQIKKDGIYVKFFPFHLSFKYYSWEQISKAFIREYKPLLEYGGWGLRIGLWGNGKALNVSGNKGLQLEFFDKNKLLIGTNKPEELKEILKTIDKLKE